MVSDTLSIELNRGGGGGQGVKNLAQKNSESDMVLAALEIIITITLIRVCFFLDCVYIDCNVHIPLCTNQIAIVCPEMLQ